MPRSGVCLQLQQLQRQQAQRVNSNITHTVAASVCSLVVTRAHLLLLSSPSSRRAMKTQEKTLMRKINRTQKKKDAIQKALKKKRQVEEGAPDATSDVQDKKMSKWSTCPSLPPAAPASVLR